MPNPDDKATARRRGMLALLGASAALPAAAQPGRDTPPGAARAGTVPPGMARKESAEERRAARYRETDHVRAFYLTNRY